MENKHQTRQLAFERKPLAWVKPNPQNAKLHPPDQVERLAASIRRFGFNSPLLCLEDGSLVAGHGRLSAAQAAGLREVPVVVLGGMTSDEARAYALADNRLADLGSWDSDMLEQEIVALRETDATLLADAGYTEDELEKLLEQFRVNEADMPTLDDGDKVPFQQRTFTLHNEQVEIVDAAIELAKDKGLSLSAVNDNGNGNAIYAICRHFIDSNQNGSEAANS